jgi:hypothetical protein
MKHRRRAGGPVSDGIARTDGPAAAPTGMPHRLFAVIALGLATMASAAPSPDPLKSPECRRALDELERTVDAKPPGAAGAQRVAAARRIAADACLGRSDGKAARSGAPYPAEAVPPPVISGATAPRPQPAPAAPARPAVITTCDTAGCWDSEGRRLNQIGPLLVGPRGPCTVQGGLAQCP